MQVHLVPMRAQRDSEEVKVLADNLLRVHHIAINFAIGRESAM